MGLLDSVGTLASALIAAIVMLVFAILSVFVTIFITDVAADIAGLDAGDGFIVLGAAILAAASIVAGGSAMAVPEM